MQAEDIANYPHLNRLYGDALLARSKMPDDKSFLLSRLPNKNDAVLVFWEQICRKFLEIVVNPDVAAQKIVEEINGSWKNPDFDSRLKDSILELRVICDLSTRAVWNVTALTVSAGTRTPDFACTVRNGSVDTEAYLEVKNVRVPVGITDTFRVAFKEAQLHNRSLRRCNLHLEHYWDNTVSSQQRKTIVDFVNMLQFEGDQLGTTLILTDDVDLSVPVQVKVLGGNGEVTMTRLAGGSYPIGPLVRTDALIAQIEGKIEKALLQLASCVNRRHLIALNIESPDHTIWGDTALKAQEIAKEKSGGTAECLIFLNHSFLDV